MFKLVVVLCAAAAVASAGYLEPAISSYGYSTSTVLKSPIVAHVAPIAYHHAPAVVYKAPVATSYQSFTKIDKPAIAIAPVHYAAPIIKTYSPAISYAHAPIAHAHHAPLAYSAYSPYSAHYSAPYAYGHHLYR